MDKECDRRVTLAGMLAMAGSVMSGVIIALAAAGILMIKDFEIDSRMAFAAYLTGSIGFVLSAPLSSISQIIKKFPNSVSKAAGVWGLTIAAINILAIAIGAVLVLCTGNFSEEAEAYEMTSPFLCGAFLLFVSGGIYWIANRKCR